MRTDAAQRLSDETDLAAAITDGDLELHYQPVIDLATGRPTGAEALVRWRRQGHGLVRPDLFIPLAEECGLIVDLGRWVLRRACLDAQDWATTVPALATGRVNVNVSTRQLVHPHFLDDVRAALTDSGLPVSRLVLEITESALIEDREHTLGVLAVLRGMGLRLALDDFGTGYSSLSWLQNLPADVLKIDKSFIDPVTGPGRGTALAEVVLKLAEVAGLQTVAEGIETAEQAEALRQLGCQYAQGYLWSRPLPLDALAAQLSGPPTPRQRQTERRWVHPSLRPDPGWTTSCRAGTPGRRACTPPDRHELLLRGALDEDPDTPRAEVEQVALVEVTGARVERVTPRGRCRHLDVLPGPVVHHPSRRPEAVADVTVTGPLVNERHGSLPAGRPATAAAPHRARGPARCRTVVSPALAGRGRDHRRVRPVVRVLVAGQHRCASARPQAVRPQPRVSAVNRSEQRPVVTRIGCRAAGELLVVRSGDVASRAGLGSRASRAPRSPYALRGPRTR
jgi:EAL domain-containing protein (putative c-di-GMP-specific phosphodiesterase class I)